MAAVVMVLVTGAGAAWLALSPSGQGPADAVPGGAPSALAPPSAVAPPAASASVPTVGLPSVGLAGATGLTPAGWAQAVAAENALPGTKAWWPGTTVGRRPGLDAFADRVSVRPGEAVGLYVDGSGPVTLQALRIGWYGGAGSRQVWSGRAVAAQQPRPTVLTAPIADAGGLADSRAVVAPWRLTTLIGTGSWPEGDYVIRVNQPGVSRVVPLTVRSADARGRVLLVAGTMTWQAYNLWGGESLYKGGSDESFGERSLAVSYDRPYLENFGGGHFYAFDLPLAQVAEQRPLPLAWTTDYDVARNPHLLDGAAAVVFGGHAEYWTAVERDAVTQAVAKGTNLAVLGANTAYWRVRLAGRQLGLPAAPNRRDSSPRLVVGAKQSGLDPLARTDPAGATARFRDPPAPRPEEQLTGMRYDCFPADAPLTVADAAWWGYAGTGLRNGDTLPGVVASESDRVYPVPGRPKPMQVVAYTRFTCRGRATAQTSVYWTAPSGAGVFTAGTMNWVCAARAACTLPDPVRTATLVSRITLNVLTAFAAPAAGRTHPAADTVGRFWLPTRNTSGSA